MSGCFVPVLFAVLFPAVISDDTKKGLSVFQTVLFSVWEEISRRCVPA